MSLADWEHLAKIFQGFATGAAIIFGALWALFRFWSLREIKQAKLRIKKEQRELQEQPIINLTMTTKQVSVEGDDGLYISVSVIAKNSGTQIARMAYEGHPAIGVFLIEYSIDGEPTFHKKQALHVRLASDPNEFAKTTIVRPGQTQEIPFLIKLTSPGLYFISFRAVLSEHDRKLLLEAGVPKHRIVSWTAKQYLSVQRA